MIRKGRAVRYRKGENLNEKRITREFCYLASLSQSLSEGGGEVVEEATEEVEIISST
jgi:hypothetical protein